MPDGHSVSEVGIEAADVACNAPLDIACAALLWGRRLVQRDRKGRKGEIGCDSAPRGNPRTHHRTGGVFDRFQGVLRCIKLRTILSFTQQLCELNGQSRPEEVIARTHLEPIFRRLFTQLVDLLQCHVGLQQGLAKSIGGCSDVR